MQCWGPVVCIRFTMQWETLGRHIVVKVQFSSSAGGELVSGSVQCAAGTSIRVWDICIRVGRSRQAAGRQCRQARESYVRGTETADWVGWEQGESSHGQDRRTSYTGRMAVLMRYTISLCLALVFLATGKTFTFLWTIKSKLLAFFECLISCSNGSMAVPSGLQCPVSGIAFVAYSDKIQDLFHT